jgi:FKBP-type peptidyl-prolyl cis-trans isomerase
MFQVLEMLKLTNPKDSIKFLLTIFGQKRMNRIIIGLLLIAIVTSACKKEVDQQEIDRLQIEDYVMANNLSVTADPSGLFYAITDAGNGRQPELTDEVEVRYKGYLLDGTVFDQTDLGKTDVFYLGSLIPGWQIGIPLLREGGKGVFIHPSYLAFGSRGARDLVGPNEVLVFEIELLSIRK